jgi:hypothetical protein
MLLGLLKRYALYTRCGLAHTINLSHACRDFVDSFNWPVQISRLMSLGQPWSKWVIWGWETFFIAGSARAGQGHLITEVLGSRTQMSPRTCPGIPMPWMSIKRPSIYRYGILYCLAFLEGESSGKGVLAFLAGGGSWDMAASFVMHVHFQVR